MIEYNNIKNKKHAIKQQNEKKNLNALFLIAKILKHDTWSNLRKIETYIDSKISNSCFLIWNKKLNKKINCERKIKKNKRCFTSKLIWFFREFHVMQIKSKIENIFWFKNFEFVIFDLKSKNVMRHKKHRNNYMILHSNCFVFLRTFHWF